MYFPRTEPTTKPSAPILLPQLCVVIFSTMRIGFLISTKQERGK